MKKTALALAAGFALAGPAYAQTKISDDTVKIGVMTDMSGQFSHCLLYTSPSPRDS